MENILLLTLYRKTGTAKDTLGQLFVNENFFCYTLEDEFRTMKVYGETRIASKIYKILPRREGGLYARYSARFKKDMPMLWLQDVPNFDYIYLHILNTEDETDGCVGVGNGYVVLNDGTHFIKDSTQAFLKLHSLVMDAWNAEKEVYINILDGDRIG